MADPMIDINEAMRILGCDEGTLREYINTGQLRAQSVDGRLLINGADVQTLQKSIESDDGTIILAEDSEDLSIDLGDVIEDSQATLASDSQDAAITFDESDQLELVDFDDGGQSGPTEELSFTESNTAVMSEVDETLVDATGGDLENVDYGDLQDDDDDRRPSSRRSVHSQRYESINTEADAGPVELVLAGALAVVLLLAVGPFINLAIVPSETDTYHTGERVHGSATGWYAERAGGIAGFSVEPNPEIHAKLSDSPHVPMDGAHFRFDDWLNDAAGEEDRIAQVIIDEIRYENDEPVQAYAKSDDGLVIATYNVELDQGATRESGDYKLTATANE